VQWAFTTNTAFNWHPLTWLSHVLDFQLFGLNPTGPHPVNLLLHTVNVLLLFWVLWRATGFAGRSAMVAGLLRRIPSTSNVEPFVRNS
jgi:protein O-mannosyl-transferase